MTREPNRTSRVLVASGTRHIRDSLQTLLNDTPVLTVVAVVATASQLRETLHNSSPEIVIIDEDLPGLVPSEYEDILASTLPSTQVIYIESCCGNGISAIVQRMGGIVVDRTIAARDFLEQVLSLVEPPGVSSAAGSLPRLPLVDPSQPAGHEGSEG